MSLVYVTGVPGTGKTTVCEGLESRGYISYDIDRDGLAISVPDTLVWELSQEKISDIKIATESEIAFVCGTVTDDLKLWDYFDKHIALVATKAVISNRLITRTNHTFGKLKQERDRVLERMPEKNAMYQAMGAFIIDATQPKEVVVDQVLIHSV